jgi:RHH-type rel operon transcriptional repressor/antitoxin RelB
MKMGTIPSPWPYDVVLESTLSATNARPGGRSFYAGRRMTGVPGLQTGMALPVPSRMTRPGPDCACRHLRYIVHKQAQRIEVVRSTTFTVRVDAAAKRRLERLAKSTGRSRSFLAAEAIHEYLDVNEWQVAGIKRAIASLDRGKGVPHERVKDWVTSWGSSRERPIPKRS